MSTKSTPGSRSRADLERPLVDRLNDVLDLAVERDLPDDCLLVAMIGQRRDVNGESTGEEMFGQITVADLPALIEALGGRTA